MVGDHSDYRSLLNQQCRARSQGDGWLGITLTIDPIEDSAELGVRGMGGWGSL